MAAAEWSVLLPLWRRFIRPRGGRVAAVIGTAAVWFVIVAAVAGVGDGEGSDEDRRVAAARESSPTPQRTAKPSRTRAASQTPRATVNPTPQPTPTPEAPLASAAASAATEGAGAPAAPAPALTIVSSSSYTDGLGTFHVAGEVRNNSPEYMEFVEITGTFFDAAGQEVASDYIYTHADFVAPGETAGFDLIVVDGGGLGVSRYELEVQGEATSDRPALGLVIQGDSSSTDDIGDFHVVGLVMNQSDAPAEFVKIVGTFYAADGTVVRSDFTYTDLDIVAPGESTSFDLTVLEGASAGIARYSLKVEGAQP